MRGLTQACQLYNAVTAGTERTCAARGGVSHRVCACREKTSLTSSSASPCQQPGARRARTDCTGSDVPGADYARLAIGTQSTSSRKGMAGRLEEQVRWDAYQLRAWIMPCTTGSWARRGAGCGHRGERARSEPARPPRQRRELAVTDSQPGRTRKGQLTSCSDEPGRRVYSPR